MIRRPAVLVALVAAVAVAAWGQGGARGQGSADERRSGSSFMSAETRALQGDDAANPGMLAVADGEALWTTPDGPRGRSCADCHGDGRVTMRGVAARYPALDADTGTATDLQGRINLCRTRHMEAPALPFEQHDLLALTAFVGLQSRGLPIAPPADPRLDTVREDGRALFTRRFGQLDFSCAACHDDNWGRRLGAAPIPQAHPTGYPLYRLEWQAVGSLQRRLRNCMAGVRAEPLALRFAGGDRPRGLPGVAGAGHGDRDPRRPPLIRRAAGIRQVIVDE
jgi:L-cysteine S-thiosulfotransferase